MLNYLQVGVAKLTPEDSGRGGAGIGANVGALSTVMTNYEFEMIPDNGI